MEGIKRYEEIDLLKGIGIILMIIEHIGFGETFDFYIHSFHMPMFYFIFVYLFKPIIISFKEYFVKKKKVLIIHYSFFFYISFDCIFNHIIIKKFV